MTLHHKWPIAYYVVTETKESKQDQIIFAALRHPCTEGKNLVSYVDND